MTLCPSVHERITGYDWPRSVERASVRSPETLNAMPPGRASVGVSRSHAAPRYAIAGKIRIATLLCGVSIGLLLDGSTQTIWLTPPRRRQHSKPAHYGFWKS